MDDQLFIECRETKNYAKLIKNTESEWKKIVKYLVNRHNIPPSTDEQDILQIIYIAITDFVDRWEPERGMPIGVYVRSRCIDKALKYIFKARRTVGAGGKLRGKAARHEVCLSSFIKKSNSMYKDRLGDSQFLESMLEPIEPIQERVVMTNKIMNSSKLLKPVFEVFMKTGSFDKAAEEALNQKEVREVLKLTSKNKAKRVIKQRLERIITKEKGNVNNT